MRHKATNKLQKLYLERCYLFNFLVNPFEEKYFVLLRNGGALVSRFYEEGRIRSLLDNDVQNTVDDSLIKLVTFWHLSKR